MRQQGRPKVRRKVFRALLAVLVGSAGLTIAAPPSRATFPGTNGVVAYQVGSETRYAQTTGSGGHIYLTGSGRLTNPQRGVDSSPAWSPDGERIAFSRFEGCPSSCPSNDPQRDFFLMVINKDGTGERKIISSDAFDRGAAGFEEASILDPAWTSDGRRISFVVVLQAQPNVSGIWTIGVDGSGLERTVAHSNVAFVQMAPEWSPTKNELAYGCVRRESSVQIQDYCVLDADTREERLITIGEFRPNSGVFVDGLKRRGTGPSLGLEAQRWTPDGSTLLFTMHLHDGNLEDPQIDIQEVFAVDADGSDLRRLTHATGTCPFSPTYAKYPRYVAPAAPSPDGKKIVVRGTSPDCTSAIFWTLNADGSAPTPLPGVLIAGAAYEPDWQPEPPKLTVQIDDGHDNVLEGLKVELRTRDGTVINDTPTTTPDGDYVFDALPSGDEYVIRATLVDNAGGEGSLPSFEIRHTGDGEDAVWIDVLREVRSRESSITERLSFDASESIVASNVEDELLFRDDLDDMAHIYFRLGQYVDWIKANVTSDTGTTLPFYTFATADPLTGDPFPPKFAAYRRFPVNFVVMSPQVSDFEERDGVKDSDHADDAPENAEWHEFTHHLWHGLVTDRSSCRLPFGNHLGWPNADTCDSMSEGFAMFLPTLADQHINGEDNDTDYAGIFDIEANWKAWYSRLRGGDRGATYEDDAVAALFWDLVDDNVDSDPTEVIASSGEHRPVAYTDETAIGLHDLWAGLTADRVGTVADLRRSVGSAGPSDITEDLDADGTPDVATLDEPFLMHGFFPVTLDEQREAERTNLPPRHVTYHYDVDFAQDEDAVALRNAAVGRSDHYVLDEQGAVLSEIKPRESTPLDPKANIAVRVQDASGTPLPGGEVELVVDYPGGHQSVTEHRMAGADGLVHLELPPYFGIQLPDGAPLPPCDPAHEVHVDVTVRATFNGYASTNSPSFDNCTYQRAAAEAEGPAALSFEFTFPEDSIAPQTTVEKSFSEADSKWTVSLACADPEQDGFASGCARTEYSIDGGDPLTYSETLEIGDRHTLRYRSVDAAGNEERFRSVRLSAFDDQPPIISITSPADDTSYLLNEAVNADYSCADDESGVSTCEGPIASGASLDTSKLGEHEFTVAATDAAGNETSLTHTYRVVYDTEAFLPPVDSPPELNGRNTNAAESLKWRLRDASGSPQIDLAEDDVGFAWVAIDCESRDALGGTTPAESRSGLSYDTEAEHYVWVTKPPASFAGTCQQLEMRLNDGSVQTADFRFS